MATGRLVERMQSFGTTIFAEMSALARAHDAVNLGQGFPDTDGPDEVLEAAVAAIRSGHNQYPPGRGIPELLDAVAAHQKRWYGVDLDPTTEVLITAGATEAIAASLTALAGPGDEVLMFEPYYDSYAACVALGGATRRCVTLRAPDFAVDLDELRAAVSPRTRVVLLNSPHNPTGKVFTRGELEAIAAVCIEHDLVAITDEVYEHLVYDGQHVPLSTLPGMRERTVTISSAAKTFSVTGWKVGWVSGPAELVSAVLTVKQFLTYVNAAPLQPAVAAALALPDAYFDQLRDSHRDRRDRLVAGLRGAGLTTFVPAGTYFVTTDIASIGERDGLAFCRELPARIGVAAVPEAVFYDDTEAGRSLVRFAFCKRPELIDEGVRRLAGLATARAGQPG
ncbi:MAG TPA: pyridoxal phosphate-dependent aminotransferase [Actinomycetes bacterium]|nr:pyridoxal phosphate-dependent aminotransferase [Actinomycetes bacterium]